MKQAKSEADSEIAAYRKEQDNAFHLGSAEVRACVEHFNADGYPDSSPLQEATTGDSQKLVQETEKDIGKLKSDYQKNKDSVVSYLMKTAQEVNIEVPAARKKQYG